MKKFIRFIIIIITFLLSLTIFSKVAGLISKGSKGQMAKLV